MNCRILIGMLIAFAIASCSPSGHENEKNDEHEEHNHSEQAKNHEEHAEVKFQYTAYSADFELFAETDAFIVGEKTNVLSHFSKLPDFKAVETGKVTIVLTVNGKETKQLLNEPTRKGIYSFDIQPEIPGKGRLTFEIANENGTFTVIVPEVEVFANDEEAHEASERGMVSKINTTVFTKEQTWKIDFATELPFSEPFGQIIKATAMVQTAPDNEMVISAKTSGIVVFNAGLLAEGNAVSAGQTLLAVMGSNMADNNIAVKYAEAKNNFAKASADYERARELAKDQIVSEKELLSVKNQYDNAKAVYDNLSNHFNASGQTVTSSQNGFIKKILVKNGEYVQAGQPVAIVMQDRLLVLKAEVPAKHALILANIKTANIRNLINNQTYSLEQLKGKVLSYSKYANNENHLIPVNVLIENDGNFIAGSFTEVYFKIISDKPALSIPNTSLMEEQGNFFVWVQVTPELFEKREVLIAGTDGIMTEIKKGITANERIVTRGAMLIKLAQATGTLDAHSGHVH